MKSLGAYFYLSIMCVNACVFVCVEEGECVSRNMIIEMPLILIL